MLGNEIKSALFQLTLGPEWSAISLQPMTFGLFIGECSTTGPFYGMCASDVRHNNVHWVSMVKRKWFIIHSLCKNSIWVSMYFINRNTSGVHNTSERIKLTTFKTHVNVSFTITYIGAESICEDIRQMSTRPAYMTDGIRFPNSTANLLTPFNLYLRLPACCTVARTETCQTLSINHPFFTRKVQPIPAEWCAHHIRTDQK